ncbi:MAG: ATP-binding protein, partial [Candidatus Nitrosopolaris sp.]
MILNLFRKNNEFYNIHGYDDIKDIVRRALDAEDNYNLLFIGPPASAKTLFLLGILDMRKDGVYFDGSNTTNRILDVLEQERPKVVCIDELDKMPRTFQNQLLNFCDDSIISSSFCLLELEWQEIIDNTFKKCVESFKYKCFIF